MSNPFNGPRSCYCVGPPGNCPCIRLFRDSPTVAPIGAKQAARDAVDRIFGPNFSSLKKKEQPVMAKLTKEQVALIINGLIYLPTWPIEKVDSLELDNVLNKVCVRLKDVVDLLESLARNENAHN